MFVMCNVLSEVELLPRILLLKCWHVLYTGVHKGSFSPALLCIKGIVMKLALENMIYTINVVVHQCESISSHTFH